MLFQDIYQYIPAGRFVTLKTFDNLLHIICRNMLKQKFNSNINFFLVLSMLGWYIPPSLVYDRRTLQEPSVHICRSSHSTMDPKYSLNVLVISLFLRMLSTFSFNIMFVYALLCLFENENLHFTEKSLLPLAWYKGIEVF